MRRLLLVLCTLPGLAAAQTIVLPNGLANAEGNSSNLFPWGRGTAGPVRIQAVYDSSNFTAQGVTSPIRITRLRFRPNTTGSPTTHPAYSYQTATVTLSTCPLDQSVVSTTFANNVGADQAVVFNGPIAWSSVMTAAPGPQPFLVDVPLSTPFVYDPLAGDLNIDTDLPVQTVTGNGMQLDIQLAGSLSSRVFQAINYPSPNGTIGINHGVVVEITYGPAGGSVHLAAPAATRTPPAAPLDCNTSPATGSDRTTLNRFSGELLRSRTDVAIAGRGTPVRWETTTRSRLQASGASAGNNTVGAYDVRVVKSGTALHVGDGRGNDDRFALQPDGSWRAPGVFRHITQATDVGEYTLTFENGASWELHPLDGSPVAGKLRAINDRNGTTTTLVHDAQGRLVQVIDTVGRNLTIAYDAAGHVTSVTDCAGRVVTYAYYQLAETGGNPGDLKSVTTPPVVGTPHGNDFPSGKTTTYTYTGGFANAALNSDLVTITDPKGQTYLTNVYAHTIDNGDFRHTLDPTNLYFDRLVRQVFGDAGDVIDWVYEPETPSVANNFAVIKVIENDRVGNVSEYFYDAAKQEVIRRHYTGRAPDPDGPTSSSINRPTAPLRATDPPYYETRWQYNADGLVTRVDHPEGDFTRNVYEIDLNPAADPISRGNLREVHEEAGPRGSQSQAIISTFYTYLSGGGGCCGTNFVLTETDGRGAVTTHVYDAAGNRTRTTDRLPGLVHDWTYNAFGQVTSHTLPALAGVRRVDAFSYYATGMQAGYLERTVVDQGGAALTTTYEYDCVGNVTRKIDPRGNDTLFVVNALDQVVAEYTPETAPGSGIRYETLTHYDANDNVVRVDVENRDEAGALGANTHFTTAYQHEILNQVTRITYERTAAVNVVEEFAYDANRNLILVRKGEAANGAQPDNVVEAIFDERDLLFRVTRAAGTPDQSTTELDYDGNGNTRFERSGTEGTARVTEFAYDGHDRLQDLVDAMGNLRTYRYDANDNVTQASVLGQLVDDQNPGPRVLLAEEVATYDAADRVVSEQERHFDPTTGAPIGDGNSTTTNLYDGPSLLTREQDDRGNATVWTYDSAHRPTVVTDAENNLQVLTYDANSNVTVVREDDRADSGAATQVFTTTYVFDGLDRATRVTDNRGNAVVTGFDSRDNLVRTVDALGDETRHEYDGLSRLLRSIRDMNGNGASAGDAADILTQQGFDDTSRLISRTDDNGNATLYFYDALDRVLEERFADGTRELTTYDVHDNPVTTTDQNGSVVTDTYDFLDRLTQRSIVPGPGVAAATTFEQYQYDGNARGIRFEDDDSLVLRAYDSLDNVVAETIDGRTTQSTFDGMRNELTRTYPGGTAVQMTYDALGRVQTTGLASPHATYDYVGPARIERRVHSNGTRAVLEYDGYTGAANPPGDFGVARVVRTLHDQNAGAVVIDDHAYGWDRRGSKTARRDVRPGGSLRTQQFAYDRGSRLTQSSRSGSASRTYALDGVHNRTGASYAMSAQTPVPADRQVNQYTKTLPEPLGKVSRRDAKAEARSYDANGNLTAVHAEGADTRAAYDYGDQMVEHERSGALTTYRYDALGRRIGKTRGATTTEYVWAGRDLIEERAGGSVVVAYVYGAEAAVPVVALRAGQTYVLHTDDQGSVTAVTDSIGNVVERYDYFDFGTTEVFAPDGTPRPASTIGNTVLYHGQWLDAESGLYRFHTRYLEPAVGRFTTRDTIGIWGDPMALGNGYTFVGNDPWSLVDPMGTAASINTSRSNIKDKASLAGEGIGGVEVGLKKKPGGSLSIAPTNTTGSSTTGKATAASINTSRSNIKDKASLAGEGIGGVEVGLKKKPGGSLSIAPTNTTGSSTTGKATAASINTSRSNIKDKASLAGEGIGGVEVGLKKKPGGQLFAASINTSRSNIKDKASVALGGIGGVEVGLKKKGGGLLFAASINTSRSNIKDKASAAAAASINTTRSNIKDKSAAALTSVKVGRGVTSGAGAGAAKACAAGNGIGGVDTYGRKKRTGHSD